MTTILLWVLLVIFVGAFVYQYDRALDKSVASSQRAAIKSYLCFVAATIVMLILAYK